MNITALPAVLDVSTTAAVAALVSGLLALFAPVLASIPGLRPNDAARSTILRVLLFALNLGLLLGLAWTQNIVVPREMIPALLVAAGGGSLGGHVFYTGVKAAGTSSSSATATPSAAPSASAAAPAADPLALATQALSAAQSAASK